MRTRAEFNAVLENIMGPGQVYFQTPDVRQLRPPYIVYDVGRDETVHADNLRYSTQMQYTVQLITRTADDPAIMALMDLPYSSRDRHYVSDQLHHYIFNIYF